MVQKTLTPDPKRARQIIEIADAKYAALRIILDRRRERQAELSALKVKLGEFQYMPVGLLREREEVEKRVAATKAKIDQVTELVDEAKAEEERASAEWQACARLKTSILEHCAAQDIKVPGADGRLEFEKKAWL